MLEILFGGLGGSKVFGRTFRGISREDQAQSTTACGKSQWKRPGSLRVRHGGTSIGSGYRP
jgi:hypothetical protein